MILEGEYFEVLGFLFGLDDMERIVVVESIAITASGGGGGDEEIPDETTTTTVPATTTTTTVAGATTSSTSSTTTTTTTTLPPTTTTIPAIEENLLSVSITVKLFTRTPLLPIVVIGDEGAQADETGPPTEGDAGGDFGQSEFGIDGEDAPANAEGTP